MTTRLALASYLAAALIGISTLQVVAHGDPELEEHEILTVSVVTGDGGLSSAQFALVTPPMTVELLWRVNSEQRDEITFSVLSGSTVMIQGLKNGAKSRIPKAERLTIGAVAGTEVPFEVEIVAHTVHWH